MVRAIWNFIKKILVKIWGLFVAGKGIQGTVSFLWKGLWKEIDRILGLIARELLKLFLPIKKNKVFFFTQEFRYGCNPKYICQELLRRDADVDIVWRFDKKRPHGLPDTVRKVQVGTYEFYKEILSANVVVANSYYFLDQILFLKPRQTLIQTWHGSLGIKRFGAKDMKVGVRRTIASVLTGLRSDYCVTNSTFVSGSLRSTYWKKTPMWEFGHPRNDLFFEPSRQRREQLRRELCREWGVAEDTRFVMYGPTFRDNEGFECYDVDFGRLLAALKERFGGNWCVLLRYHPSLLKLYKGRGFANTGSLPVINVTDYIDMQELIAVTDVAITDYSSWIYDFMLLRRPGFIYATDIELYNNERGFCYPLETTPFPIATNNDELAAQVAAFDEEKYLSALETFLQDKGCVEDGHASERVVDKILEIIGQPQEKRA